MVDLQPSAGRALVIGGGRIAHRKVRALSEAGFEITVIAPALLDAISILPGVTCLAREFADSDITSAAGLALVFACTNDRAVNQHVGELAKAVCILVNVADARAESTFFSTATHRDGPIQLGVSTGGTSPATARKLRDHLAGAIESFTLGQGNESRR